MKDHSIVVVPGSRPCFLFQNVCEDIDPAVETIIRQEATSQSVLDSYGIGSGPEISRRRVHAPR